MKRATVVIGANAGDEGKGKMVDYFASQQSGEKVVVRFNGGAQAGHTVVTPDGKRHVFAHFGSGTLAGAQTYLAKHYVCNPILFWKEHRLLRKLDIEPVVAIDPRCFVTTPYDMMINQAIEDQRGDARHGSVGVGFGETIERNNYPAFQLWKADLADAAKVKEKLYLIRDKWLPTRCGQLGIPKFAKDDHRLADDMLGKVIEAISAFDEDTVTAGAEFLERKALIFEGAQGLLLDQNSKWFPHVTRSSTGLINVMPIAQALGLTLDVIYVTRPYLTRHGAGPLTNEYVPDPPIEDKTNEDHPYQGKIRFGTLDTDSLLSRIKDDMKTAVAATSAIAMTCCDQVGTDTLKPLIASLAPQFSSTTPKRDSITTNFVR